MNEYNCVPIKCYLWTHKIEFHAIFVVKYSFFNYLKHKKLFSA